MALRPPGRKGDAVDLFAAEVLQEKAANLARLGRRLEDALRALAEFDEERSSAGASPEDGGAARRDALVRAAGEALWYYVIQREVTGLRDNEAVMRELRVPREVRLRMGFTPSSAKK